MNCEHVEELLSAYLDDTLATEEFHDVATHVQTCCTCHGILTEFRHFDVLLAQLPRVAPDQSLRENLFFSRILRTHRDVWCSRRSSWAHGPIDKSARQQF